MANLMGLFFYPQVLCWRLAKSGI